MEKVEEKEELEAGALLKEGDEEVGKDWIDPGQQEGVKKKDPRMAQEELTEDHPRFKKVYGKMKDFERQIADMRKDSKNDPYVKMIMEHNKRLQGVIEKMADSKTTIEVVAGGKGDELSVLQEELKVKKAAKVDALSRLKHDEVEGYDEEIYKIRRKIEKMEEAKAAATTEKKTVDEKGKEKAKEKTDEIPPEVQAVYDTWIDSTPWLKHSENKNLAPETKVLYGRMKRAAMRAEEVLSKDPDFVEGPLEDTLAEVRRIVEVQFNYKDQAATYKKGTFVDGGGNTGGKGKKGQTSNELSYDELKMCREMGLDPKSFLAQRNMYTEGGA